MPITWTEEQILQLAPDAGSVKAGRGLASASRWVTRGRDDASAWGECKGSGADPYQVAIDLGEPAYRCSCPSRKFPCKHALGLFLMLAASEVPQAQPPEWATAWLAKRAGRAEKPAKERTEEETAKAAADSAKREEKREAKVAQGLADLDLWLRDLVRQGLGALSSRGYGYWDTAAARLVDAQAPGLSRMVRELAGAANSGEGCTERLVSRIGLIHLLIQAHSRIETLSEPARADVRAAIGWTFRQEEVLRGEGVTDFWQILGERVYDEDHLTVHRTWMLGRETGRFAMALQFVRPGQPIEWALPPGAGFEAEMVYFPGAYPLRALIRSRLSESRPMGAVAAFPTLESMLRSYSGALAQNPWIETYPAPVANLVPYRIGERWYVRDAEGRQGLIAGHYPWGWKLASVSGGHPITVVAEWDGETLFPLFAFPA
jgi:hypothetical protein